jgi:RND family efflux transporter MFP subunit
MRSLMVASTVAVALFSTSCGDGKPGGPAVTNAAPAPPATESKPTVAAQAADSVLLVTGPIIVEHQMEMTAQRDGVVAKIFFEAPTRVKSGTILARLDDRQIASNLAAARAKSRSIQADLKNWESEGEVLQSDYVRAQRLWDLGLISEEQLQHAKYKAESDKWEIKRVEETLNTSREEERSLELELEKISVAAPFDGIIARRYVREGQNVAKGDRLFWITAEGPLLMRFTLPEKYFGQLVREQQFEVTSPDVPGEKHAAKVKEISPVIDPSSGTFEVLVALTGEPGAFHPGMTANLKIVKPR